MIQRPSKEFNLLVYDAPYPPRSLTIKKRWLRLLVVGVPVFFLLSWIAVITTGFFLKDARDRLRRVSPAEVEALEEKNAELENELVDLKLNNKILKEKVASPQAVTEQSALSLFHRPMGFKDRSTEELVSVEEVGQKLENNKVIFNFNLVNTNKVDVLSGHLFILLYSASSISFFPDIDMDVNNPRLHFNAGESFSASRFRPVVAEFKAPTAGEKYFFHILIFSRVGDLLYREFRGPYM